MKTGPALPRTDRRFIEQIDRLLQSFRYWTSRDLLPDSGTPLQRAERLHLAGFAVIAHGVEPDPILYYGNQTALRLWEMSWDLFTRTPSRLTAEPDGRAERALRLAEVAERGFIRDYRGVRISRTGRRFRIEEATIWNIIDDPAGGHGRGRVCGQAATFQKWLFL